MSDLNVEISAVRISDDRVGFDLVDGRTVSVPLAFYPTLLLASREERETFEITGTSVYWSLLDCNIGSAGLLLGAKEASFYAKQAYARKAAEQPAAA